MVNGQSLLRRRQRSRIIVSMLTTAKSEWASLIDVWCCEARRCESDAQFD
jgi:hypothetical protein